MIVCLIELFFIIYLFNIDLEVRMKKENDKDLVKAMKYLNDKIADITDTIASMETKLEKLERQVSILDENMHQVDWTVGSFDNDTFKLSERMFILERKVLRLMKKK